MKQSKQIIVFYTRKSEYGKESKINDLTRKNYLEISQTVNELLLNTEKNEVCPKLNGKKIIIVYHEDAELQKEHYKKIAASENEVYIYYHEGSQGMYSSKREEQIKQLRDKYSSIKNHIMISRQDKVQELLERILITKEVEDFNNFFKNLQDNFKLNFILQKLHKLNRFENKILEDKDKNEIFKIKKSLYDKNSFMQLNLDSKINSHFDKIDNIKNEKIFNYFEWLADLRDLLLVD